MEKNIQGIWITFNFYVVSKLIVLMRIFWKNFLKLFLITKSPFFVRYRKVTDALYSVIIYNQLIWNGLKFHVFIVYIMDF